MTDTTEQPTPPAPPPAPKPSMATYGCRIHGDPAPLFGALAKAQGLFGQIERTKHVKIEGKAGKPGYEFDYAPLDEVLRKTIPHLSANGLCLMNTLGETEDGTIVLGCMLAHESGAFIFQYMKIPPMQRYYDYDNKEWRERPKTNQEMASDVTYRRRYMDGGILCVAPEMDDDGAASSNDSGQFSDRAKNAPPARQTQATPPKPQPKAAQQSAPSAPTPKPAEQAKAAEHPGIEASKPAQQSAPPPSTPAATAQQQTAAALQEASGAQLVGEATARAPSTPPAEGQRVTTDTAKKMSGLMKELGFTPEQTRDWCVKLLGKPPKDCRLEAEYLVLVADLEARKAAT